MKKKNRPVWVTLRWAYGNTWNSVSPNDECNGSPEGARKT